MFCGHPPPLFVGARSHANGQNLGESGRNTQGIGEGLGLALLLKLPK